MSQPEQTLTAPGPDDLRRLAAQRAVLERHLSGAASHANYRKAPGKLGLIRALLESRIYQPHQTYELQCMGVILGDAFVDHFGFEWVVVEDAQGRDPALRLPDTSIILFPLTMISKRVEQGEAVDVFDLFNGVAGEVDRIRKVAD